MEVIPKTIKKGVLYISIEYGTAIHSCACGCGSEVVTPLSPHDWQLTYDGETISLSPSIGNWSFDCKSHYWIRKGKVVWAENWSTDEIIENRQNDARIRKPSWFKKWTTFSCIRF